MAPFSSAVASIRKRSLSSNTRIHNLGPHTNNKGDIVVGNDVWIGFGALIVSGVTIGDGAMVPAGAVIVKDVPPYAVVGGNPAHVIRYRFSDDVIARLLRLQWWRYEPQAINPILERHSSVEAALDDLETLCL